MYISGGQNECSIPSNAVLEHLVAPLYQWQYSEGSRVLPKRKNIWKNKRCCSNLFWITAISVAFATLKPEAAENMKGSQEIGTYLIYMFLFVIGIPANTMTVVTKSPLFLVLCAIM